MPSNEFIDLIQQRLGDPLSDQQHEYLAELADEQPRLFSTACQEIKAQNIEVIPVDLEDESAMDDLLAWLNQLAATRNAGKGFNNLLLGVAVILVIGAIGSWLAFFGPEELEVADNNLPDNPVSENSTDRKLEDSANKGPTEEVVSPASPIKKEAGDPETVIPENPDNGSPPEEQEASPPMPMVPVVGDLMLPERPVTPTWQSFDDPAARLDHSWTTTTTRFLTPAAEEPGSLKPIQRDGTTEYFELLGNFTLPPPDNDGRSLRMRFSDLRSLTVTAINATQQVELNYDGHLNMKRYTSLPIPEYTANLPYNYRYRMRRHFVESRVDPMINFDWGLEGPIVNDRQVDRDYFSVEWSGVIVIPKTDSYIFHLDVDDGYRLEINNSVVGERWSTVLANAPSAQHTATLPEGSLPFKLQFFSDRMEARAHLSWESEGLVKQIVPASQFKTSAEPDAQEVLMASYCFGPVV